MKSINFLCTRFLLCIALYVSACSKKEILPTSPSQAETPSGGVGQATVSVATPTPSPAASQVVLTLASSTAMLVTPTPTLESTDRVSTPMLVTPPPTKVIPSATPLPTLPQVTKISSCPGAPEIKLAIGDWARVSVEPPQANRIRSTPDTSGALLGEAQPGENLMILDGPECGDGYTWWQVRSLEGLEGWTAEGDSSAYWLVEPISVWYDLPEPILMGDTFTYSLRELLISPETGLVTDLHGEYLPLATPLPTPLTAETPEPDDPRGSGFGTAGYAAHSDYSFNGAVDGYMGVFDLQDPLSRYYMNHQSYNDCSQKVKEIISNNTLVEQYLPTFCGLNGAIPTHFKANLKVIEFTGGKGIRFLVSSANYLTVNKMNYRFLGLSDDGRFFITVLVYDILHPYIVDDRLWEEDFGPFIAWKDGQYEAASQSYEVFNGRMKELLEAGLVELYPSLEILDAMMASIVIK